MKHCGFEIKYKAVNGDIVRYFAENHELDETLDRETLGGIKLAIEAYWVDYDGNGA